MAKKESDKRYRIRFSIDSSDVELIATRDELNGKPTDENAQKLVDEWVRNNMVALVSSIEEIK